MSTLKTITVDGFYSQEQAIQLRNTVWNLPFKESQMGKEIENFNLVPADANTLFSNVLRIPVEVDEDRSGVFRFPILCTHFEEFDGVNEWCFAVALSASTFNLFKHIDKDSTVHGTSDATTALEGYKFNYKNLFEWDVTVNYLLEPGQGIFFRPWLFHSFDSGLIQMFRLKEV